MTVPFYEGQGRRDLLGRCLPDVRSGFSDAWMTDPSTRWDDWRPRSAKARNRGKLAPATPCERALAHPALVEAVKCKLRGLSCRLNPLAILAALRSAQVELGNRVDRQADQPPRLMEPIGRFAEALSTDWKAGERRAIHRRPYAP
jgi:hypothetical protein